MTWFLVPNLCYTLITAFKPPRCTTVRISKSTVTNPWRQSISVTPSCKLVAEGNDQSDPQSAGPNAENSDDFPTWKKAAIAGAVSLEKLLELRQLDQEKRIS